MWQSKSDQSRIKSPIEAHASICLRRLTTIFLLLLLSTAIGLIINGPTRGESSTYLLTLHDLSLGSSSSQPPPTSASPSTAEDTASPPYNDPHQATTTEHSQATARSNQFRSFRENKK
ncbi:hypothetical protein BS78_06G041700 [Paspalum vaginatum]|nr:hypothetical protein BS78_06G041700 [Paspalum vaginatum]